MGRFLTLLLGFLVVAGLAYYTLKGASPFSTQENAEQKGLQPVRQEAKRIEEDSQRRAQEMMNKTGGE